MALNDIFALLFAEYAKVKSSATDIRRFYDGQIQVALNQMNQYVQGAVNLIPQMVHTSSKLMARALDECVYILDESLRQSVLTTDSITNSIQAIFNTYLYNVLQYVQDATMYVEDSLYDEVYNLALTVDYQLADLQDALYTEMEQIYSQIDNLSVDVIGWIDAAVGDAVETLQSQITTVNEALTKRLDFLQTLMVNAVTLLYGYIDMQIDILFEYIERANNTLYGYINNRVIELESHINSVSNDLNQRIDNEVNNLTTIITSLEVAITERIDELAGSIEWHATFFDLFTITPELAGLKMLLRDETLFQRFKPYWQALFVRVMAED